MRLNHNQIKIARQAARHCFGDTTKIWLFGSRVDDNLRGGDFDFLIEADLDAAALVSGKLNFLIELRRDADFEEEKIDVVITSPQLTSAPPIIAIAKQQGILL
ncbi:MAG: nucleotidyltransferase domain-containing protein [Deefgea sp.]